MVPTPDLLVLQRLRLLATWVNSKTACGEFFLPAVFLQSRLVFQGYAHGLLGLVAAGELQVQAVAAVVMLMASSMLRQAKRST